MKRYYKDFLALFSLALVLWGGEYVRRDLWEPDEARFAYVSREMRASEQWFVPQRYGVFYAHKPPVLFWLTNLAATPVGGQINNITARIPTFLGAVLALWMTWLMALKWFDRSTAWKATAILSTSYVFWHEGSMGRMDSILCGLEMLALFLFLKPSRTGSHWPAFGAYCCMGLAILTKGPVGLLVPLGAGVTFLIASGGKDDLKRKHMILGPALALLFPALWLLAAHIEGAPPEYFKELLFKQNIGRLTGAESFGKPNPFYYYLWHFPLDFLPWTIFLPFTFFALKNQSNEKRKSILKGITGWILFVILFFSLSTGKRNIYILCAFPATSILIAHAWNTRKNLSYKPLRVACWILTSFLLLVGITGITAGFIPADKLPIRKLIIVIYGIIMLAGSIICMRSVIRKQPTQTVFYSFAILLFINQLYVGNVILPALNTFKTPKSIVPIVQSNVPPDEEILLYKSTGNEIVPLYCDRKGKTVDTISILYDDMRDAKKGAIIFYINDWREIENELDMITTAIEFRVGNKRLACAIFDISKTSEPLRY